MLSLEKIRNEKHINVTKRLGTTSYSWPLFVSIGLLLFLCLFITGASLYPGGSDFDTQMEGYHLRLNYWCELMGENGKNGEPNRARILGILGMLVLSLTTAIFWLKLPMLLTKSKFFRFCVQTSGVISMLLSFFIFQFWHDLLITLSVLFGSIAFLLSAYFLLKKKRVYLFIGNVLVLTMIYLNGLIYVTKIGIPFLPIIQKITFLMTFVWMLSCCFIVRREKGITSFFAALL